MQRGAVGLNAREQPLDAHEPLGLGFTRGIESLLGGVEARDGWHQRVEARGGGMLASDERSQLSIDGPGKPGRAGSGCEEQHDETVAKAAPVHQESRTPGHRIAGMDAPAASRLKEREEIRERRRDERKRMRDDQQSAEGDERARDRVEAPPMRRAR